MNLVRQKLFPCFDGSRDAIKAALVVLLCASGGRGHGAEVPFNEHIRPIFAKHCVACHGGVKQASGLSFIYRDKALAKGDSGAPAIVPGDVEASRLVDRITDADPDSRMPPAEHGPPLSAEEIAHLKQWIAEGAQWQEHWSFLPPQRHEAPRTQLDDWAKTAIDPFVLAKIEAAGLAPSPEASREQWLRRVSFDLIGLPPTMAERQAFLADDSPDAYQRVVDRLLASKHFGERWAAMWLDLARYADTMGFEKDPPRDVWPYRDWLIRSLNDDLPYDEFLVKQLAGDLLPDATMGDRLAAVLQRNTQTNTEGGTDDEEFRTAAVLDRVSTNWQVFGGLTFGCTQCHSHPYDPIEHDEYYQFVALFNNTRDYDRDDEAPRLEVPRDRDKWSAANQLDRRIRQLRGKLHEKLQAEVEQSSWESLAIDQADSTGETRLLVRDTDQRARGEFATEGTVTVRSMFTLTLALPEQLDRLTAVRIDALPQDLEEAWRQPEMGFVLTRLRGWVVRPDGEAEELYFALVVSDERDPLNDPNDSLSDANRGWAVEPQMHRPHWAVFAAASAVEVPPGSKLKLQLKQNASARGTSALVINRGRVSVTDVPAWIVTPAGQEYQQLEKDLTEAIAEREAIPSISVPGTEENAASQTRPTFVFERGNWLDRGQQVSPGLPAVFGEDESAGEVDRLAAARWFASPEHPLTARVQVNRIWEQLFGTGIVETVGDFGTSGTSPSHPELLDDLAARFATDMQWSFKQLLRELVLSATYRQQSTGSPAALEVDARNRLLSHGPRQRLTAEMVRDQGLVLSGHFSEKMYGPPVMPPQPAVVSDRNGWGTHRWETAEGPNRYRRALYTYWKRTDPYPAMMLFDAPTREVCSVQRIATNTPLQPLVTMNDIVFVECAQGLAKRMAEEGGESIAAQIEWAMQLATTEAPSPAAVEAMLALHRDAKAAYQPDNAEQNKLAATADDYAMTIVASAILNLDDAMTR